VQYNQQLQFGLSNDDLQHCSMLGLRLEAPCAVCCVCHEKIQEPKTLSCCGIAFSEFILEVDGL
jgi:hypothetical protein